MRLISLFCAIVCVANKCSAVLNLQISNYYENISITRTEYKCGNELLVDEPRSLSVDIASDRYIFHAWCTKDPLSKEKMDLKSKKYGADMIITGDDVHEGKWNCSFLSNKNVPIYQLNDHSNVYTHTDNATYLLTTCRIIVRVKRSVTLNVFVLKGNDSYELINWADTGEVGSVHIRPGQHLLVNCTKNYEKKDYLKSGSLVLKNCFTRKPCGRGDNYCNQNEQYINKTQVTYDLKNNSLLQSLKSSKCEFESAAGVDSSATMEFTFQDDRPPQITVDGIIATGSYRGRVDSNITLQCTNQQGDGMLQSSLKECPAKRGSECESHIPDKTGKETIQEILSLSIEKEYLWECRYINMYGAEKHASLQIITISCTNTKPVTYRKIERSYAPKMTSVTNILACIYKTAFEEKFNTTVMFKVNQVEYHSTQHYSENSLDTFARRHKRSPKYCYTTDITNNYEGPKIMIKYNGSNENYECGSELFLEKDQSKLIVIHGNDFKKIRCINKQRKKDFIFQYGGNKYFTEIDKNNVGDWDCIFLLEKYQNIVENVPGVCQDTDGDYYKRLDCQLIIRVNNIPSSPSPTIVSTTTNIPIQNSPSPTIVSTTTNILIQSSPSPTIVSTTTSESSQTLTPEPIIETTTANGDQPGSLYTLSPSSARYGDLVQFTCNAAEVTAGDTIQIILVPKDGKKYIASGEINKKTGNYEGAFIMDFRNDVETFCTIYNKDHAKKSAIPLKLSYVPTEEITGKPPKNGDGNNALIYGAIGGGIVIIAILIIAIWRICRSPPKDAKRKSSVTYENLSNESQGAHPPFPAGAQLEETYIQPNDYIDMESPYAVSRNPETDTYAQPFVPKLEDLYSKPVPKNLRIDPSLLYSQVVPKNQRNPKNETSELNYAEIEVKKVDVNDKKKYVNVKDSSPLYASIANQQDYANIAREAQKKKSEKDGSDDYTNVFNNEQYSNSKGKPADYAEPTYCQVNNK